MILTVHNRELVLSRYQAKQLCFERAKANPKPHRDNRNGE